MPRDWNENQAWDKLTHEERLEYLAAVAMDGDLDPASQGARYILEDEASLGLDAETDPQVFTDLCEGGLAKFIEEHATAIKSKMS